MIDGFGDFLSIDSLQAKIQADIGQFLGLKAVLMQLQRSQDPNIVNQANELYGTQVALEGQLSSINEMVQAVKLKVAADPLGSLVNMSVLSSITTIGSFAVQLESQNSSVTSLQARSQRAGGGVGGFVSEFSTPLLLGAVFIGATWFMMRRR